MEADWAQARRLATSGPLVAYAYAAMFKGTLQLCTLLKVAAHVGGAGCGPYDPASSAPKLGKVFTGHGGPAYMLLLPDGVDRVEIELSGGRTVTKAVDENGIVYQGHGVHRFTWTDANGVQHMTRAGI
jgi:hypothetical protein